MSFSLFTQYKGLPKEVYVVFISRIIMSSCSFIFPLLTLILTVKLNLSTEMACLFLTISGLILFPASIIGGKLADSFPRKKVFTINQIISCIIFFLCGIIPFSFFTVIILIIAAFFSDLASPSMSSIIFDVTCPQNRTKCSSLTYLGWNLGICIGPAIGGLFFRNYLSFLFMIDATSTLISVFIINFYIKESTSTSENSNIPISIAEQSQDGSIFKIIFQRKFLILFSIAIALFNFGYDQWGFLLPIELEKLYGSFGAMHFGFISSFNGIVAILFTPILTKLLHPTKNLKNIFIGGCIYLLSMTTFALFSSLLLIFFSMFLLTLGEIILSTNVPTFMANNTPKSHRGRMSGLLPLVMSLGYVFSPIVSGTLLKHISFSQIWFIALIMILIGLLLISLIKLVNLSFKNQ